MKSIATTEKYLEVSGKLHVFLLFYHIICRIILSIYRISQFSDFSTLENVVRKEFSAINREINALSSKMDICLMNQEKLNRFLLPGEKVIKKPSNFPSLPVNTKVQLNCLENFLRDDGNLSATVSMIFNIILLLYKFFVQIYSYLLFFGFLSVYIFFEIR